MTDYLTLVEGKDRLANRKIFRFEDLPPELRNQIYHFALVADSPITFERHVNDATIKARKRNPGAAVRGRNGTIYGLEATVRKIVRIKVDHTRVFRFGAVQGAGMLRANKATHNEARAILYACNNFKFKSTAAFRDFHDLASNAFHILEKVELVDTRDFTSAPHPMAPFTYSTKFPRLTLGISNTWDWLEDRAFQAIKDLVLSCGCRKCLPSNGPPNPAQSNNHCVLEKPGEQLRRLKAVSISRKGHQAVHFRDGVNDERISDRDGIDVVAANLWHRANELIRANEIALGAAIGVFS